MPVLFPILLLTCGNSGGCMLKVLGNKFEVGNQHTVDTVAIPACTSISCSALFPQMPALPATMLV